MRKIVNFLKGSLIGILVLTVFYTSEINEVWGDDSPIPTQSLFDSMDPQLFSNLDYPEITPTLTPSPTATPIPKPQVQPTVVLKTIPVSITPQPSITIISQETPHQEKFEKYSQAFNVDKALLVRIAKCESGFRPDAVSGPYLGMYQYLASTWSSTRREMGENPDPSLRTNPEEAIKTTAWKIAHGGRGSWPVCGR